MLACIHSRALLRAQALCCKSVPSQLVLNQSALQRSIRPFLLGVRSNSQISTSQGATHRASPNRYLVIALGSALSAFFGYYAASIQTALGVSAVSRSGLNEQYGSPDDFQRAIKELRETFPAEDAVSTDPEDLHVHGFSENDYHPGT